MIRITDDPFKDDALNYGDELDVEAGLQAHRHYDSETGRWLGEEKGTF